MPSPSGRMVSRSLVVANETVQYDESGQMMSAAGVPAKLATTSASTSDFFDMVAAPPGRMVAISRWAYGSGGVTGRSAHRQGGTHQSTTWRRGGGGSEGTARLTVRLGGRQERRHYSRSEIERAAQRLPQ